MKRSEFIQLLMSIRPEEDPLVVLSGDGDGNLEIDMEDGYCEGFYKLEDYVMVSEIIDSSNNFQGICLSVD